MAMSERHTIEIYILMDEAGAFVVDDDSNVAAERAGQELGKDAHVRQLP
jgi:hypothetical protein